MTCDANNLGSATVIESCGGALENVVLGDGSVPDPDIGLRPARKRAVLG